VAISPNGKLLAATASHYGEGEDTIHVWDMANGDAKYRKSFKRGSSGIAFSPDSNFLALADTSILLLESNTGRELRKFEDHTPGASSVRFSSDGKIVASIHKIVVSIHEVGVALKIWDSATGKSLCDIKAPENSSFQCLAVAPDGKSIATGNDDGHVWLWDIASAKPVRHFKAHECRVTSVSYTANGKLLATASDGGGVALWDPTTGKKQCKFSEDRKGRYGYMEQTIASIAPDGRNLASATGDSIRLWDVTTGSERADLARHPLAVLSCTFSPDGKSIWTNCGDHVLRSWDSGSGKLSRQITLPEEERILAVSDDAKLLLTRVEADGDVVRLWQADSRKQLHALAGHRYGAGRAVFSPDRKRLAIGDYDSGGPDLSGMVHLWDVSTGKELHRLSWEKDRSVCSPLGFSRDSKLLACGGFGEFGLWDPSSGKLLWKSLKNEDLLHAVAFSEDSCLVAALYEHSLDVYEVDSGKEIYSKSLDMVGSAVAFAPGGRVLLLGLHRDRTLSGLEGIVHFLDLATGEVFGRLSGHEGEIYRFALSSNSKVLATASNDTTVLLWNFAAHKPPPLAVKRLSTEDRKRLWADLAADDARTSQRAIWTFLADQDASLLTIKDNLKPAIFDAKRVEKLIHELDDDHFFVRTRAMTELENLGELATNAMRKAAAVTTSLEVQWRLKRVLDQIEPFPASGERLRSLRAVRLLEQTGTADARKVLETTAEGAPSARVTIAAKAALKRLKDR